MKISDKFNQRFNEGNQRKLTLNRGNLSVLLGGGRVTKADIYHGEVALPRGVATTVTERARPLQGITAALAAVQGHMLLAP